MKVKKLIITISLIGVDQAIKFYIYLNLMNKKIIFNEKLGFLPYINKDQMSIFNKELKLGLSLNILIGLNILVIIFIPIFYYFYKKKEPTNAYSDYAMLFMGAGAICVFYMISTFKTRFCKSKIEN